jgi:hypothetical protein
MDNTANVFATPEDGWFHIASPGEWPHQSTGLVQVIDQDSILSIVDAFRESAKQPNWPGVLIDFDHQSLDQDKPTVAAGWILELDQRDSGIWAKIKWSDLGRSSIEGGRYRFISPVWKASDCVRLDGDKIRPLKLMNCAVTNDPNIKGMFPLSNASARMPAMSAPAMPLVNRIRSDEERRAMFAAMMGGGGGGAQVRGAPTPAAQPPAPADPPPDRPIPEKDNQESEIELPPSPPAQHEIAETPAMREYSRRIAELKEIREQLDANRPDKPEPPIPFDRIDERKAMEEAMKQPNVTSNEVLAARDAAREHNTLVKSELNRIKRNIRKQYKDIASQDRALQRVLDGRDAQYSNELERWNREQAGIDAKIQRVDREIHATDIRLSRETERARDRQYKDDRQAFTDAQKAHYQAIRDQINADKEVERQRQVELRKERDAATAASRAASAERSAAYEPVRDYRSTITARRTFWDAVSRGDYSYAKRIMPDADMGAAKQAVHAVNQSVQGQNVTARRAAWNELRTLAPVAGVPHAPEA